MLKLQANMLLVNKILSMGLKVQFHVNECIVGGAIGHVVAVDRRKRNLYLMTFTKVCRADSSDFGHSRMGGDSVEL